MEVPRYEQRLNVPTPPDAKIVRPVSEDAFGGHIAEALEKASLKLSAVAAKQREESDTIELSLLSAKADAFADELYVTEQQTSDYEGTVNRYKESFQKFSEDALKETNPRIRAKATGLLAIKGMGYDGKFKGLLVAKQRDYNKRILAETIDLSIKNLDEDTAISTIENSTMLSQEEKGNMIMKTRHDIQVTKARSIVKADPFGTHDLSQFDALDADDHDKLVNYAYTLKNRIQEERREVSRETQNAMEAHYFKTGQIWTPKELDYLKGIGKLDTQGYSDMLRFSINEKESRIREARAEARLAQTLWASMATEEEKQWFKLQQQGTTVAMNTAEMKRLNVALAEGTLTPNMLIESQAKGLIMPTQRTMLYNQLTQQKAEYKKVYGEMAGPALKAARDMLTPLVGAGHVAQEDADDAIIALSSIYARQGVPVEQVDDAMRKVLTGIKFRSKPSDGFLMWGETDNYEVTVPIYEAIEGMKEIGIGAETEALFSGGKTAPKVPSKTKQVGLSGNGSVKLKEGTPEYKQWIKDNL